MGTVAAWSHLCIPLKEAQPLFIAQEALLSCRSSLLFLFREHLTSGIAHIVVRAEWKRPSRSVKAATIGSPTAATSDLGFTPPICYCETLMFVSNPR